MKKRNLLSFIAILFLYSYSYSQDFPAANVPDLFPTSPEVSKLGKYGNIQHALNTGNMNFSVPIYTITTGGDSWPISLQYSYGGLILEEKQSLVGLGWRLQATGAVRREVRGKPDEHPNGYFGVNNRGSRVKSYVDDGVNFSYNELQKFMSGEWDRDVDIYHVSVAGLSFSFKLDQNRTPIFLSPHNNKVQFTNQDQVVITDGNGVIYTFSDKEKNEPSDATPDTAFQYTISWNLSTIKYPSGRVITFHYENDQYLSYDFYAQGSNTYFPHGLTGNAGGSPIYYGTGSYQDGVSSTTINRKILNKISFAGGEVNFTISNIGTRKVYSQITVSNTYQQVNDYRLSFAGQRDVLTEVTNNNQLVFGFEYFDQQSLPNFLQSITDRPYAQDDWRFFNGQGNSYAINIPFSQYSANKTPSLLATKKGAMRKIHYPTGGYSEISYEQNQVKEAYTASSAENASVTLNREILVTLQSDNNVLAPLNKEKIVTHTFNEPVVATISSKIQGTRENSHLFMSIYKTDVCPPSIDEDEVDPVSDDYYQNVIYYRTVLNVSMPQMCPTLGEEFGPDDGDPGYYTINHNSGGRIIIKPGTYVFKISNDYNRVSDAYGEIKVNFHQPNNPDYINVLVGGIRVNKIVNSDGTAISKTQNFDYNDGDFSSGFLLNKKSLRKFNVVTYTDDTSIDPSGRVEQTFISYPFSRFNSLEVDKNAPVYYRQIKEYYTSNENNEDGPLLDPDETNEGNLLTLPSNLYPNGYKVTKFVLPAQDYGFSHLQYPKTQDLSKGRIEEISIFSKNEKLTETTNNYKQFRGLLDQNEQDYNTNHPWSLRIAQKERITVDCRNGGVQCSENPSPQYEHFYINRFEVKPYREIHHEFRISNSVNTSFLKQNNALQAVATTTATKYNNYNTVSEVENTDSKGNMTISKLTYPFDFNDHILTSKNRISQPIEVKNYIKKGNATEELLNTESTTYRDWPGGIIEPEYVRISKGLSIPENRLQYHSYYTNGNIKEVSKKDGTSIVYIWGYYGQYPIAKIENASYAEVSNQVTNLQNKSNLDTDRTFGNLGTEGILRSALSDLRNTTALSDALVTTYTYDPLIGVTSITDPKGQTIYYHYDDLHRLELVTDKDNKVLHKNEYNYKN